MNETTVGILRERAINDPKLKYKFGASKRRLESTDCTFNDKTISFNLTLVNISLISSTNSCFQLSSI